MEIWCFGYFCATIPDADVLMFDLGYSYGHWLGHRGFFHSIFFAFIFGFIIKSLFYRGFKLTSATGFMIFLGFSLITVSHGVLDAMTTG
ncbi:MAG: metal-dependent hydrolase, partial [Bacteroidia bacterium]|nr:metal-dependent hydrolase [Bacteroidia bacterium]